MSMAVYLDFPKSSCAIGKLFVIQLATHMISQIFNAVLAPHAHHRDQTMCVLSSKTHIFLTLSSSFVQLSELYPVADRCHASQSHKFELGSDKPPSTTYHVSRARLSNRIEIFDGHLKHSNGLFY